MGTVDGRGWSLDQAEDALQKAMQASDVARLRELLFEGLAFELPNGTVTGRSSDLDAHASGAVRFEDLVERDRQTVESSGHGRTASLIDVVVLDGAERISGRMQYRRYWSVIDGRWQVVAGSAEPID